MRYAKEFGRGARCAFLCLALPGSPSPKGLGTLGCNADSLTFGTLRVYRASEQLFPLFVTDEKHEDAARKSAQKIADFLKERVPHSGNDPAVGDAVRAESDGCWYDGIASARRGGVFDISWSPPYAHSPTATNVCRSRVRRSFKAGDEVEAREGNMHWLAALFVKEKWFPASVGTDCALDGRVQITWQEGGQSVPVPGSHVRRVKPSKSPKK